MHAEHLFSFKNVNYNSFFKVKTGSRRKAEEAKRRTETKASNVGI
jgi:hypothetical protein